jgi:cation diffusion facilitator family transporter
MSQSESKIVVVGALLANILIAIAKFVAAFFTLSTAMLAEGFHSLADSVNEVFLLLGIRLAARPADRKHQFGHAMERYFWAFVVAISIFTVGAAVSMYEGVHRIIDSGDPASRLHHSAWAIGVLLVSLVLELVSWTLAMRQTLHAKGKRSFSRMIADSRDPVILTVLFEDSAAIFGLLAALAGLLLSLWTGNMIYDGVASVVVGIALGLVAYFLARETKDLLLGESVPFEDSKRIRAIVESSPCVMHLVVQRTMHLGPEEALAALKVKFADGLATDAIEEAIDGIERALRAEFPYLRAIWIEPGHSGLAPDLPLGPGRTVDEGPER